jgi:hypothetical protein
VMDVVTAGIEVPPLQTAFERGTFAYPTALDLVGTKTTAYNEYAKIALSDIVPIYLRKDKTGGETLVLENDNQRHGWVEPEEIPLANADSGFLLLETGDKLLYETGDKIILNETAAVTFGGTVIENFEAPYGENVVNRATAVVTPRRLDASPQILFQLEEPITLTQRPLEVRENGGSGTYASSAALDEAYRSKRNFVLKGTWANPEGGEPVGGRDMITPVITTDYLMNSAEDGSGVDISADLIFTIEMGSEGFTAYMTSTNSTYPVGYVTKFNVRGTGIYQYNPVGYTAIEPESIAQFETQAITLNQKYRAGLNIGRVYVDSVVEEYSTPRTRLKAVTFCANKSSTLMMAFLHTDVGHLKHIDIDELGIDCNYWIQGVGYELNNGLIWVTWVVKEAPSLQGGFTDIAMDFTSADGDAVDFLYLPRVSDSSVTERTFAAWINADLMDGVRSIIAPHADSGGVTMFLSDDGTGRLWFYSDRYPFPGTWRSNTTAITTGSWFHVVVCYDHSLAANDPIMYINGVAQTVIEDTAPSGTLNSEVGTHLVVGNTKTITIDYAEGFDGKIYDARIYDRIITAAEALTLYNGGTPDPSLVTDGLVFQAFTVRTDEAAGSFVDVELDDTVTVFENMYKAAGYIHGTPIGRVAP